MRIPEQPSLDGGRTFLDARQLDRVLAFIDGSLAASECERLLAELSQEQRRALAAMRADSQALRAVPHPEVPEELHEAVMSAAERAELLAPAARGARAIRALHEEPMAADVIARPWGLRWGRVAAAAAVVAMGAGVTWIAMKGSRAAVSTSPVQSPSVVPVALRPVSAPYAVVLEYDDPDDAQVALLSAISQTPDAQVTCCCRRQCTTLVEGPPHVVEDESAAAEFIPIADVPSHQLVVPASELSRVLGTLVSAGNGSVDVRRVGADRWPPFGPGATVEVPIFIVPASR